MPNEPKKSVSHPLCRNVCRVPRPYSRMKDSWPTSRHMGGPCFLTTSNWSWTKRFCSPVQEGGLSNATFAHPGEACVGEQSLGCGGTILVSPSPLNLSPQVTGDVAFQGTVAF